MPFVVPPLRDSDRENLIGLDTGREHLSHSALSQVLACPQKYSYVYEDRLELARRPAPLSLGSAFQKAIEHSRPGLAAEALIAERDLWDQRDADQLAIDTTIVVSAATLYLNTWPVSGGIREFGYRVRLRNPWTGAYSRTFDLLGFADEVIDHGAYFTLVENKLVGQITEINIRKLPLDRQIALACYGLWRATGQVVREIRYRWVRKPSIRQRKDETVEDFCDRLKEDYATRPDFYSHEEHVLRSSADLARVEGELWQWAEQVRAGRRAELWPRNTTVCGDYGGCAFLPLCLKEPGASGLYQPKPQTATVPLEKNIAAPATPPATTDSPTQMPVSA